VVQAGSLSQSICPAQSTKTFRLMPYLKSIGQFSHFHNFAGAQTCA
jgi:hypothetical protein